MYPILVALVGLMNPIGGFLVNVLTLPLRTLLGNWTYDFLNARLQ